MAEKEYIDREILLKMNFYTENCNSEENRWNDYAIKDIIRHIPAADVAPVKHGHWSHLGGDEFCCTNCGHIVATEGSWEHPWQNYCPNCGAKMDGGDSND